MIIFDMEDNMDYRPLPKTFEPLIRMFNKLKTRFYAPTTRSLNNIKNSLEYYLTLSQLKDFVDEEMNRVEQHLLNQFTESGYDIEYLEEYGLKVKLLKEYGTVFAVEALQPSDAFKIQIRKRNKK